jgi:hypothetical protein
MKSITKSEIKKVLKFYSLKAHFLGANLWQIVSDDRLYQVEVFFQGYDHRYEHGLKLKGFCNCTSAIYGKPCLHADKAVSEYERDFSLLFGLFGMEAPEPMRFDELNQKIIETERKLRENSFPSEKGKAA